MKIKSLTLASALVALATPFAHADAVINITGATAFRKAVIDGLVSLYDSAGAVGTSYNYATSANGVGSNVVNAANAVTFRGTFPGITGVTTIRCSWNGSVEGIRALTTPGSTYNAKYIDETVGSNFSSVTGMNFSKSTGPQYAADFAFSDVLQTSTPELSPTLNPTTSASAVGIVVFSLITNKGTTGISNISTAQFRALFGQGYVRKYLLTGVTTDTSRVFAVGRNDGSGTRTTYLAETGFGVTKLVKQYAVKSSTSAAISQIQLVPADGGSLEGATVATPVYASTIWGNTADGNGGYASGGTLVTAFTKTTSNTSVLDEFGDQAFSAAPISLVTWVASGDVASNIANVVPISYNGVLVTPNSSGPLFSATDKAKVTTGVYTAWGTERLYYRGTIGTLPATGNDYKTFYDALKTKLDDTTIVDASGVRVSEMLVNRSDDGGVATPIVP